MHRRWLAGLRFEHAVHHVVLEDCTAAVEAAMARRDRLEAHIAGALPDWSLAMVAHGSRRCAAWRWWQRQRWLPNSVTSRASPIHASSRRGISGLVPADPPSGGTRRQGPITSIANGAARRMLIEAAWSHRFPWRHQPRAVAAAGRSG